MRAAAARMIVCAVLAFPLYAQQQFPSLEKGLQPEKTYQFGNVDNVNMFNGNLTIVIPIGMTYPLNGDLSYHMALSYNSNIWEQEPGGNGTTHGVPSRRSNAGLGWVFGMGRYISNLHPSNLNGQELYESPDGGDHRFNDPRSSLRLRSLDSVTREIDFPDGTIHQFKKVSGTEEWELRQIRSWRSSHVITLQTVSVPVPAQCPGDTLAWLVSDSLLRNHYMCFQQLSVDGQQRPMIHRVILEGPGDPPQLATYELTYDVDVNIGKAGFDDTTIETWAQEHHVPLLKSLVLPDGSTYEFAYYVPGGEMKRLTLPTRGVIEYTHNLWDIPSLELCSNVNPGPSSPQGNRVGRFTAGVSSRTFIPAVPTGQTQERHTWTYNQRKAPPAGYQSVYDCSVEVGGDLPLYPVLWDEVVVEVKDPNGDRIDNHFSIYVGDIGGAGDTSTAGFERKHFSLPYGTRNATQNRHLSQESFDCTGTNCERKRAMYVRHQHGTEALDPHWLESQATFFEEGPADCGDGDDVCWQATDFTLWDGYGHHRVQTSTGNFGNGGDGPRVITTTWNQLNGANRVFGVSDRWILNTYESIKTTEGSGTVVEQACFDTSTGFLLGKRQLAGTAPGSTDLLARFAMDTDGNLSSEKYFGGHHAPMPATVNEPYLCNALTKLTEAGTTPTYEITIPLWSNGRPAQSKYTGVTFFSNDLTIDPSGLVTKSRDPSGLETSATYDASGRLKTISRPGMATTTWTYTNAASTITGTPTTNTLTTPASVTETTASASVGTLRRQFQFDSFGRIWRGKKGLADGVSWSVQETLYDAIGNRKSASEVESLTVASGQTEFQFIPTRKTLLEYDIFGRATTITPPDHTTTHDTKTTMSYRGGRATTRTQNVATSTTGETAVSTTEYVDSQGRLARVVENSASTTDKQETTYGYDAGGRLISVSVDDLPSTNPPLVPQARTFVYDGRGFLTSETHPESGTTSYSYDSRGHVRSRTTANGTLSFARDSAERLETVKSGSIPLKEFSYDSANSSGYSRGKLLTAIRHNHQPDLGGDVKVTETYYYGGAGGALSSKKTSIAGGIFPGETFTDQYTYTDLGAPLSVTWPQCTTGCTAVTQPARTVTNSYANGWLSSVGNYADPIEYHPNGMLKSIRHRNAGLTWGTFANGPLYEQTLNTSNNMARPDTIQVSNACTSFRVDDPPDSVSITSGQSTTLSVTVAGATTYQWYMGESTAVGTNSSSLNISPTSTTSYWVRATNGTCTIDSPAAAVTVLGGCPSPTITAPASIAGGATATASVPPTATSYSWSITGGSIVSSAQGPVVTFQAACSGTVTLTITVTTGCGTPPPSQKQIPVVAPSVTLTGSTVNQGENGTLTATLQGPSPWTLTWSDGLQETNITVSPHVRTVTIG